MLEGSPALSDQCKVHKFTSSDGTPYSWEEKQEAEMTLTDDEVEKLRKLIRSTSDDIIQNDVSGNGIPMGIKVPLSDERLKKFLNAILNIVNLKESLQFEITSHAAERLEDDILNGVGHTNFRGWLSEDDIKECVFSIHGLDGARLTIDRTTLNQPEIRFHQSLALEIRGTKPDGKEGTLALTIIEERRIRIITLLKSV